MEDLTMTKPYDFSQKQETSNSNYTTLTLLERQNENLLEMVKQLEADKEILLFSMSELDSTLELATRTLELSEKLNAAYEFIMKQHGFSFEEKEETI